MASPTPHPTRAAATSLTEWLRRRSDHGLAELLRRRPDLGLPAPADLAALASRAAVRTSVARAVDGLDAFTLRVLEALALVGDDGQPVDLAAARSLLAGAPDHAVARSIDELRELALIWGDDDRVHLVSPVADAVGRYPAGLGRPAEQLLHAVSEVALAPVLQTLDLPPAGQPDAGAAVADAVLTRLPELLAERERAEREVLDRLAAGPPIGQVRDALVPDAIADGTTPPHRLIAHGLLVPIDSQTVELPREVGLAMRGTRPLGPLEPDPPVIATRERTPAELDRLGATAVLDLLRLVAALGDAWTAHPPAVLRTGGLGMRELRRTARELDVAEPVATVLIETAAAAGLLATTHGPEPVLLPTPDFDAWRRREPAIQWGTLAAAWLAMTRQPSLVGQRDDRDRMITPLGPDGERGTAAALRRHALGALADLAAGAAPADPGDVLARLAWQAPRRATAQRPFADAVLTEADVLGVTAAGGLTGYGRALLNDAMSAAEEALRAALPEPVDHVLVQPDLTVVVPGPPTPELGAALAAAADLESSGGASVYRITESSVRRALDTGRSGADLAALFAERSRTPVPQALSYLIEDVARRHGVLRAGATAAYLRCDDEALLQRVLADRTVTALQLRRIAPTVAVSPAPVARILDALREAGYAPSAEAPGGAVLDLAADTPRAPSRPASRLARVRPAADSPAHRAELVRRMRSGDQLSELARRARPVAQLVPGVTTAAMLARLRDAIRAGDTIWLDYVDNQGRPSQRTIAPISMAGGMLRGHDSRTGHLEAFALHHITAVGTVDEGQA